MDVRITPEPEERDAVLAAVEALLARDPLPAAYRSIWRQRAIRENVEFLSLWSRRSPDGLARHPQWREVP